MKINCKYCDAIINDYDEKCPNCGAINEDFRRVAYGQPKTIEELQAWYAANHLPPEHVTRFFIGKNYTQPRAFGIYKDESGKCIVYKNKDTGERAIRYEGYDEAFAVNELYLKLKEQINIQKSRNAVNRAGANRRRRKKSRSDLLFTLSIIVVTLIVIILFALLDDSPTRGYYYYDDSYYYYLDDGYYYYDDYRNNWSYYGSDVPFAENHSDYYIDDSSVDNYVSDFTSTSYYSDWYEDYNSSDWDSDSSWSSSDSWDSGSSDWSSDW